MGLSQMIKYLYHFLLDNISIEHTYEKAFKCTSGKLVGFCDDEAFCVISLNWSVKVTLASQIISTYIVILNSL